MKTINWISVKDRMPEPGNVVLICADYRPWGRLRHLHLANVHFAPTPRPYGGPNSLTGSGELSGVFFSVPAVLNPEVITHWADKPSLPEDDGHVVRKAIKRKICNCKNAHPTENTDGHLECRFCGGGDTEE